MWKEYNYAELEGVIKVGDRVRAVDGKPNPCNELNNEDSNEQNITEVSSNYFCINNCSHPYKYDFFLERWEEPKKPRTIEDVQEGDVVLNEDGEEYEVLARVGKMVFMTKNKELTTSIDYTINEMKRDGFTLKGETKTMTKEEAEEKFGITITND